MICNLVQMMLMLPSSIIPYFRFDLQTLPPWRCFVSDWMTLLKGIETTSTFAVWEVLYAYSSYDFVPIKNIAAVSYSCF